MDQENEAAGNGHLGVDRHGDRELTISRMFRAPREAVYAAWRDPALFRRWWVPQSAHGIHLIGCDTQVRTGGRYRLDFATGDAEPIAFYGRYLDLIENQRIVWTNDDGEAGAISTVTFDELGDRTQVIDHELYPSTESLEEALESSALALPEQLDHLGLLLCT
ncbi:MAG: SRPBCC domain-containing protein [Hyphomonadaceae bacterium]|jgi:uncharacterized protein YndB with AHSA1/START domain